MSKATIKAEIDANIKQNGVQSITGNVLNRILKDMVDEMMTNNYKFVGVATLTTEPGTPTENVFYFATEVGDYDGFGLSVAEGEVAIFKFNGTSWSKESIDEHPVDVQDSGNSADLDISDEFGNVLARFENGNFRTKCFNSNDFRPNTNQILISYSGLPISLKKKQLFYRILNGISSSYDGHSAQMADIYNNYIIRTYDGGYCRIYQLTESLEVTLIKSFALATQGLSQNHAGCGGFDYELHSGDDFPYLYYGNSTNPIWYVENIKLDGTSELLQTINVNIGKPGRWYNVAPTEDGHLLYFNCTNSEIYVAVMRKPTISEGANITLTSEDIIDSFTYPLSPFIEMQDGCVYDNKLWFVFSSGNGGVIKVFDLGTHKLTNELKIDILPNELEDCCIYDGCLYIFYNGTTQFIKINFI